MDRQIARLLQHGEWFCPSVILISLALVLLLGRRNRHFLPRLWWQWCATIPLAGMMLLAGYGYYFARTANHVLDQRLQEMTFRLLSDDSEHQVSEYKGQVVLLNFWATWCPPCRAEMPDLERLYATYKDSGLTVITVSDQDKETLLKFDRTTPLKTISGYFTSHEAGSWAEGVASAGRPFTMLIDREGRVRRRIIRYSYDEFQSAIVKLL